MPFFQSSKGFTLVEILVTIVILSIATVWAVPNLRRFSQTQTLTDTASDLKLTFGTAQDNAQSHVLCNGVTAVSWEVDISSSGYKLLCNATSAIIQKDVTYPSSIRQTIPNTNCSLVYIGSKINLNCTNNVSLDSSGNLIVKLTDNNSGSSQTILVNVGN